MPRTSVGPVSPELERKILELAGEPPGAQVPAPTLPLKGGGKRDRPPLVAAAFVPPGTFVVPLRVTNPLNGGHFKRAAAGKSTHERWAVRAAVGPRLAPAMAARRAMDAGRVVAVRLVRLGGNRMDDDGIPSAMKYVRDAVAYLVGIDDGDPRWNWRYAQEPGGLVGVRIEIAADGPLAR